MPKDYTRREKPILQATKYETYYVAANEDDEIGKRDVWLTLNRNEKWNCTTLKGSSSCYEFIAEPRENQQEHMILIPRCGGAPLSPPP